MGFHANGQLIYDISQYSNTFTHFIADIGVDSSRPQVASIKVTVSVSDDLSNWTNLEIPGLENVLKSANPCIEVNVDISGKKYLKIYASDANDGKSSDHCVLGDAKIARESYNKDSELYSKIKKIEEYDKEISSISSYEEAYKNHKDIILKRELVNRIGYWSIQNLANTDEKCKIALDWILEDEKVLDLAIKVGEIKDGYKFLNSLGTLYNTEHSKLGSDGEWELYEKMMIALSAAYSSENMASPMNFSHLAPNYDVVERFEEVKNLYKNGKLDSIFPTLKVELLRMVMQDAVRVDETKWFSYWTHKDENGGWGNTFNKGSFWLRYVSPDYNQPEYFDSANKAKYDEKYSLSKYDVPYGDIGVYKVSEFIENIKKEIYNRK